MKRVWAVQATFLFLLLGDVMVRIRNGGTYDTQIWNI
jgi:hypothetical protein